MVLDNISIARDNTIRVSQLKLANITRLIVNQKVNRAVEQLKFSNKRISQNVLKVLNSAIANAENNKEKMLKQITPLQCGTQGIADHVLQVLTLSLRYTIFRES